MSIRLKKLVFLHTTHNLRKCPIVFLYLGETFLTLRNFKNFFVQFLFIILALIFDLIFVFINFLLFFLFQRPALKITKNKPGSDLAGETAAALAAGYLVFKGEDSTFADECLSHAKDLFDFAEEYPGKYSDSLPSVNTFYKSWSGYDDELVWSASWLYRATGGVEIKKN